MNDAYLKHCLSRFGVPARYHAASQRDFPAAVWAAAKPFVTGESLFITGAPGRGKTWLAVALLKERARILKTKEGSRFSLGMATFSSSSLILADLRTTFSTNASELDVIHKYAGMRLLVIDDLGMEKSSEWVRQTLTTIVDMRYGNLMQTLVTSNLTLAELADQLGDRLSSRLSGMCLGMKLDGPDRRTGCQEQE